jgi:hypothetical protein
MPERMPRVKWPRSFPLCTFVGIVIALVLTSAVALVQVKTMQPLQRVYAVSFLKASLLPTGQNVKLIEVYSRVSGRGFVMALDPWISISQERGRTIVSLTAEGVTAGMASPRVYVASGIKPQVIREFFERSIYHGNVTAAFRPTLFAFGLFFAFGLVVGAWLDQKHQEATRRGVQIRGPDLMLPRKAQKRLAGDGIALFLEPKAK